MLRRILATTLALTLALFASSALAQQQQVRVTGIHVDQTEELPGNMRLGIFVVQRGVAFSEEVTSVRMVASTFDLTTGGVAPDAALLRPLVSGSFPLAFMIGNEFIAERDGVNFATAVLHPYFDACNSGSYDDLRDTRYGSVIPELPEFGGFFNLVYVSGPVVLRTTPFNFDLKAGWNLILSKFVDGRLEYSVATDIDITIISVGATVGPEERLPCP